MAIGTDISRLKILHNQIKQKSTGGQEALAKKLGIGVTWLNEYLNYLHSCNVEFEFDRERNTYFYLKDYDFECGFKLKPK